VHGLEVALYLGVGATLALEPAPWLVAALIVPVVGLPWLGRRLIAGMPDEPEPVGRRALHRDARFGR
jgi:hypothetical protein